MLIGVKMTDRTEAAWQSFRDAVEQQGGTVLEESWLGSNKPHRVRCAAGHTSTPRPNHTKQGVGICLTCSGRSSEAAWRAFRDAVEQQGGAVLEESWLGKGVRHRVRCPAGHAASPYPSRVQQGSGICRTCSGQDPEAAWQSFRDAVERQGGTVLDESWLGSNKPHHVRCAAGHPSTPRPANVVHHLQGACRACANKSWDAFYIVTGPDDIVKFGITSGDPSRRLNEHRADGFLNLRMIRTNLLEGLALSTETLIKQRLKAAGYVPAWGREYFAAEALPLVEAWASELLASKALDARFSSYVATDAHV